jgi:hypothetical protein
MMTAKMAKKEASREQEKEKVASREQEKEKALSREQEKEKVAGREQGKEKEKTLRMKPQQQILIATSLWSRARARHFRTCQSLREHRRGAEAALALKPSLMNRRCQI